MAPGPFPRTLCFVLLTSVQCKVQRAGSEKGTRIQGCSPPFLMAMFLLLGHGLSLIAPMNPGSPPSPPGGSTGSTGWWKLQRGVRLARGAAAGTPPSPPPGEDALQGGQREASEPHRAGGGEADLGSPGMGGIAKHSEGEGSSSKGLVKC